MASFQANIFWKRPRKRANKNYCFVPILSGAEQKMPKIKIKKIKKIKKYHYGINTRQNLLKEDEKQRKLKLQFRSVPSFRVIENSKKIAK